MKQILLTAFVVLAGVWIFGARTNTPIYVQNSDGPFIFTAAATTTSPIQTEIATTSEIKATSTPKKAVVKKQSKTQATPTPVAEKPTIVLPSADFAKINEDARKTTVNILCLAKGSSSPISGTGIVISPDGVILTNAHVGQYFLLKNYTQKDFIDCTIRTGSPSYPRYHAELVYLSPEWVEINKTILKDQNPQGTGEFDFAFLRITDSIDGSPLPSFTYTPINIREYIQTGEPVLLVGYPAGFLGNISILQGLSATSAITDVQDVFTFKADTIDILAVGGTVLSQKGSSGGGVIDQGTTLIGIISTSSNGATTGQRALNAISLGYINRTFTNETGENLYTFLTGDVKGFGEDFREKQAPDLLEKLTKVFDIQ
jgi:hypothetical protein